MKMFKLDKYKNDTLDVTYTIPVAFISILTTILPSVAIKALNQEGFDFNALIEASKLDNDYHVSLMVDEQSVKKRIEFYLV